MRIFFTLLLLFLPVSAFELSDFQASSVPLQLENHDELYYRSLRVGDAEKAVPLLLFLHGAGERGNDNEAQLKHALPDLLVWLKRTGQEAHIIAPQCPNERWWGNYDRDADLRNPHLREEQPMLDALDSIVTKTIKNHNIDKSRIYLTGLSMGGFGSFGMLTRYPERWAAAIPICGGGEVGLAKNYSNVPLKIVHGELDNIVPVENSRSLYKALQEVDAADVEYIELMNTNHDSWSPIYRNPTYWKWLFNQKKAVSE